MCQPAAIIFWVGLQGKKKKYTYPCSVNPIISMIDVQYTTTWVEVFTDDRLPLFDTRTVTHVYTPDLERFTNVRSKFENTDTVSPLGPNHAWSTTARPLADITLLHMRDSVVDSFTNVTTGGYTGIAMNTVKRRLE